MRAGLPSTEQATAIAEGLATRQGFYLAALCIVAMVAMFGVLMHVMGLRVKEAQRSEDRAEKLGAIIEKHNQAVVLLDKAVAFVIAQQPRRRPPGLPPEPTTSPGGRVPP